MSFLMYVGMIMQIYIWIMGLFFWGIYAGSLKKFEQEIKLYPRWKRWGAIYFFQIPLVPCIVWDSIKDIESVKKFTDYMSEKQ